MIKALSRQKSARKIVLNMIESIPRLSTIHVSRMVHGIATSTTKIPASDSPWPAMNITAKANTARARYSVVRIMAIFDFSVFII